MDLVIVESPAKSKTIEKYLGKNYKVEKVSKEKYFVLIQEDKAGVINEKGEVGRSGNRRYRVGTDHPRDETGRAC